LISNPGADVNTTLKNTKADAPATPADGSVMTAAQAAKAVQRMASEVLAFKDYGTHVVVVTTDGQKLNSADKA
jgi:hypothetical protein